MTARIVTVPVAESDRAVVWDAIETVSYRYHDGARWIVLRYADKSEKHLRIHQAEDLWEQIRPQAGCEPPCFFEHDTDVPPESCAECQLCATLSGLKRRDLRPAAVPNRPRSGSGVMIVVLLCLVAVLLGLLAQAGQNGH